MSNQLVVVTKRSDVERIESLKSMDLTALSLKDEDLASVLEVAKELDNLTPVSIGSFGERLAKKTTSGTDELLNLVKNKDIDIVGDKLNQVVVLAQDINLNSIINKSQRRGFLGAILNKFSGFKRNLDHKLNSTKEQIDSLVGEVEKSQSGLRNRVEMLDRMSDSVAEEYRQLGLYAAAGMLRGQELQDHIGVLAIQSQDPIVNQQIYELNHLANNLEKRVSDIRVLQQSALQTIPMIRIIQANNSMLIDKFYSIKNITLPAWKNQISLNISLSEQRAAVELTTTIDNATNELLKRNADLLNQNSIETAKINQRSVIDVETLEYVQNSLISTVTECIKIQQDGRKSREEAEVKIKSLQKNMQNMIVSEALKQVN